MKMKEYIISVIIYCEEHTNKYINKTIGSILDYSKSRESIEIILLNNKEAISLNFSKDNIVEYSDNDFFDLLNQAKHDAKGNYLNFISSGDYFYNQSFNKISEFIVKNEFTLLHFSLLNSHHQYQIDKAYSDKGILSYRSKEYNHLPIKIKGCFFRKKDIINYNFSKQMGSYFESDFLSKIINADDILCLKLSSCVVAYLDDDQFLINDKNMELDFFQEYTSNVKLDTIQQYYILMELRNLLINKSIKRREDSLTTQGKKDYIEAIKGILKIISYNTIMNTSALILQHKHYFLYLKYGDEYLNDLEIQLIEQKSNKKKSPYVTYKNNLLFNVSGIGNFKINILESKDNILIIDGIDVFSFLGDSYKIVAIDDKKNIYNADMASWTLLDKKGFIGENIYSGRRFSFKIPLNNIKKINFFLINKEGEKFELVPSFGIYSKLVKRLKMSYYAKDNYIFRYRKNGITISSNSFISHCKSEIKFYLQLYKEKKINIIILRFIYQIFNTLKRKPIWLIRDNEKRSKDSGAEMFKYYSQWDQRNVAHAYFILDKQCEDYKKMKKYGKIIQPDSFRYKLYHLLADKLIDTRGGINCQYIFKDNSDYVKDLCHWDYIWLIHGIMTRNESTWTNKFVLNAKLFATCNVREYNSVLEESNGYGYNADEIVLTGLPRHDALKANKQKKILFLPTWRKHLAGDLIPGTSERSYVLDFKDTDYYQFYNELINNQKLLTVMNEYGYSGDFYLHPSFMKQCDDFVENNLIKVGKKPADTNQLIGECSLLLTDYSSAQFEGAYLNTPVIYPQYDADTYSENHTGNDGYFDYEKDGFGPVCYDLDSTVNTIIEFIKKDCRNIEPYEMRASEFFEYRDKNNSQRVFNEILRIDGYGGKNTSILIEEDDKNVYLYQEGQLKNVDILKNKNKIYNSVVNLISFIHDVKMKDKSFVIKGCIHIGQSDFKFENTKFKICIGSFEQSLEFNNHYFKKNYECFEFVVEIPYNKILLSKKSTPIMLRWNDLQGYGYYNNLKCQYLAREDTCSSKKNRKLFYSNVQILEDIKTSIFVRETIGNNAYLCIRDINRTDRPKDKKLLKKAYLLSRIFCFHKAKNSVLCFEKFASKYEESASVLFEKIIDSGEKNTYFVIDKESIHYQVIPEKYKKYIIYKYSLKHYFYFFLARSFIATESMNHIIELNISDPNVIMRITKGSYDYIFLQHGVMYMYCLENRSDFIKGQGFTNYSKVVVSSQTEADHFIEYGNFDQEDLIISGLPKFDKSYRNPDADKILIMPTSRDFEYNIIRLKPTESTYYHFTKKIIDAVPDDLKSKIVVVGHPLLKDQLYLTDLKQYMPNEYIYDELLRDTKLLITDYSSISYDAFYRGCNVIFCWEDKEMCLDAMNYKLMLNEGNIFSDISKNYDDLPDLIQKNYDNNQSESHRLKYQNIVSYHDNKNTERCYQYLLKHGYYGVRKHRNISKCKAKKFTKKIYTGYKRTHTMVELYDADKILVKNRDYKIYYFNNVRKSKFAIACFVGKGQYFGIKIRRFKICETISKFFVSGILVKDNQLDFEYLAVKDSKTGKYLKRDLEYVIEIEDGPVENSIHLIVTGKRKYAGKIKKLYMMNELNK